MKITKSFILTIVLIAFVASKSKLGSKKAANKKSKHTSKSLSSKTSFDPNAPVPELERYSYVNQSPYFLQDQMGFKNPQIWPGTLPERFNSFPFTGTFDVADTAIHNKSYYDGSINLARKAVVRCNLDTINEAECTRKPGCGWCGQSNSCIEGSVLGPLAPCMRGTFKYGMAQTKQWNPLAAPNVNLFATDKNGNSMLKVTYQPKLELARNGPYALDR